MSNKEQLQTNNTQLSNLIQILQGKVVGGGSAETCTVTVDFPKCTPIKYFTDGTAGFSYIDPEGTLNIKEITGVTSTIGVVSYTFDPVECKCGTVLSVATPNRIQGFTKSSDAIGDPVMLSNINLNPMASFLLPEEPGNYTITVYYGV